MLENGRQFLTFFFKSIILLLLYFTLFEGWDLGRGIHHPCDQCGILNQNSLNLFFMTVITIEMPFPVFCVLILWILLSSCVCFQKLLKQFVI